MFAVSEVSSIKERMAFGDETTLGASEFEWPEGVIHLLEVGSTGEQFMHQILNAHTTFLLQVVFHQHVVGNRNAGSVDFQVSTFVNQVSDGL